MGHFGKASESFGTSYWDVRKWIGNLRKDFGRKVHIEFGKRRKAFSFRNLSFLFGRVVFSWSSSEFLSISMKLWKHFWILLISLTFFWNNLELFWFSLNSFEFPLIILFLNFNNYTKNWFFKLKKIFLYFYFSWRSFFFYINLVYFFWLGGIFISCFEARGSKWMSTELEVFTHISSAWWIS